MHHQHLFHKIHLLKSELSEVYWNLAIQKFGLSLISIFIPIYLLILGYTLQQVLIFIMVEYGILALVSPLSALLANRFGFKHIILFRTPFMLLFLAGLYLLPKINISIYLLALISGSSSSLYWTSINSIFAKFSDKLHRGKDVSRMMSFPNIAAIVAPLIGGFITVLFGMDVLIVIAFIILSISPIPLFFTKEVKPHVKFSLKKMFSRNHSKFLLGFMSNGARFIGGAFLWPIFVYFMLRDTVSIGFIATLASVGTILFTLFMGRISDKYNRSLLLRIGALLGAGIWFIRILAKNAWQVFTLSFLAGLFTAIIDVPFSAMMYDKANTENRDAFIVFRELGLGIGRVCILTLVLITTQKFLVGFSISGLASLVFALF